MNEGIELPQRRKPDMQGDLSCQAPITNGLNTDNYHKKVYKN